jgi:exonuclease VII large subunit
MASNTASPPDLARHDTFKSASRNSLPDDANKLGVYASAPGVIEDVVRVVDHKAERALCRRFDLRLLPVLAVMCKFLS